jgi:hypothetical protein
MVAASSGRAKIDVEGSRWAPRGAARFRIMEAENDVKAERASSASPADDRHDSSSAMTSVIDAGRRLGRLAIIFR